MKSEACKRRRQLASSGGGGPVQPSVSQQNSIVADCAHPCDQPACGGSDGHVLPSFVQSISSALPQGDRQKLLLARDALSSEAGFESATALPDDVQQCVRWLAHKSDEQVMAERESAISQLEARSQHLLQCGEVDKWFKRAHSSVTKVATGTNGPLLHELARET